jgi:hypothetical protein
MDLGCHMLVKEFAEMMHRREQRIIRTLLKGARMTCGYERNIVLQDRV